MKRCYKCDTNKDEANFSKDSSRNDGLCRLCKACTAINAKRYREQHRDKIREKKNTWRKNNPEKYSAQQARKRLRNGQRPHSDPRTPEELEVRKQKQTAYQKQYQKDNREKINRHTRENRHLENEKKANRRARAQGQLPPWYAEERKEMRNIYELAFILRQWGEEAEVDHIVPLGAPDVCGLHCLANLQILTPVENSTKSDVYWPDMP